MDVIFQSVKRKPTTGVAALYRNASQAETICSWVGVTSQGVGNFETFLLWNGQKSVPVHKGNWVVLRPDGKFEVLTQREFELAYE